MFGKQNGGAAERDTEFEDIAGNPLLSDLTHRIRQAPHLRRRKIGQTITQNRACLLWQKGPSAFLDEGADRSDHLRHHAVPLAAAF